MSAPASRILPVSLAADAPPLVFPLAEVGEDLDYGLDFGGVMADASADVIGLSLMFRPTGTLEAAVDDLVLQGTSVAVFNVNGTSLGGRVYEIMVTATLASGDVFPALAKLQFDWTTQPGPVPYPDSEAFGPLIYWSPPPDDGMLTGVGGDQLLGVGGDPIFGVIP